MDQVVNEPSLSDEQLQQIISALQIGFIFVDSGGCILWIDERTRQLLNGELQHIDLPFRGIVQQPLIAFSPPLPCPSTESSGRCAFCK